MAYLSMQGSLRQHQLHTSLALCFFQHMITCSMHVQSCHAGCKEDRGLVCWSIDKAIANKFPVSHPPDSQKSTRERGKKTNTAKRTQYKYVLKSLCFFEA